jgi:Xaa-Pro aminopeptidase
VAQSAAQIASGAPIEFVCDLLSGPNAAEVCCPVHVAGTREVVAGDPVVAEVLLSILAAAGQSLVSGTPAAEIFEPIARSIQSAFPGGEFPHHGGHGLGLGSFEYPHLIPTDDTPLESWMVVAVEPGVYFPGRLGARVENVFIVTPNGGTELRAAFGRSDGRA